MMRIDSHHHLWIYNAEDYEWIEDRMNVVRRDFLPPELSREMSAAAVDGTIVIQARQSPAETDWLLETAGQTPEILGVVGWAPIGSADFPATLDKLREAPLLKGLRHVVQAETTGFLDNSAFNAGLTTITQHGLVYDLLIKAPQLIEATRCVDRHPNQIFVIDHLGKPDIAKQAWNPWATDIRSLALRPNVFCKLSGLVTEADWYRWRPLDLEPYLDTVLECFGPSRLMAGSDWPVLNLASHYVRWWQLLETWTAPLSCTERADIHGAVAARTYRLDLPEGIKP